MSLDGKLVTTLTSFTPKKDGEIRFGFDINDLAKGTYILLGKQEGQVLFSEKLVRQ